MTYVAPQYSHVVRPEGPTRLGDAPQLGHAIFLGSGRIVGVAASRGTTGTDPNANVGTDGVGRGGAGSAMTIMPMTRKTAPIANEGIEYSKTRSSPSMAPVKNNGRAMIANTRAAARPGAMPVIRSPP